MKPNNSRVEHHRRDSDDDSLDPLDAYMASLEDQLEKDQTTTTSDNPNAIQNNILEFDDDNEQPDEHTDRLEDSVEDLEANVAAFKAGATKSNNKTMKILDKLLLARQDKIYPPFEKEFYIETADLATLTDEEVREIRLSLEGIKVEGKDVPRPISNWAHCGLSSKVLGFLRQNFKHPTPIQAQAIPAIMAGHDVVGIAKTGCGKTISFLLPMFRHILNQEPCKKGDGPIAVIITPTRELATQIRDDALKFAKYAKFAKSKEKRDVRIVAIHGGPNISEQIAMLKQGAEVIVCAPGRMIEILTTNKGRVTNMDRCTFLVLDEADRLFDMGFEKQIRTIADLTRPDRQTVMFSATFPTIIKAYAKKLLTNPIRIEVGGKSEVCKDVKQNIEIINEDDKFPRLLEILQKHVDSKHSAIVFVAKKLKADSVLEDLMQTFDPNCLVLHADMDEDDRMSNFSSFKRGQTRVLVATSVAARGLDVKNCICVVNYDCPNHYEDYVHRCGRTGRAGSTGFAYTFITQEQGPYATDILEAYESAGNPIPDGSQELWNSFKEEAKTRKRGKLSGFSGKGYKFDEAEAKLQSDKKKQHEKSLGIINSDDEEEDTVADATETQPEVGNQKQPTASVEEPKELTKIDLVKLRAAKILSRKKGIVAPIKVDLEPEVPVTGRRLELKFEINDYHQQVRRRLTSKDALAKISESCEVGITVRGQFCAPNDRPTEPKLYLAVEGSSDMNLQDARRELLVLVKDEYTRIQSQATSRFKVV